jgi:hypothetical protein
MRFQAVELSSGTAFFWRSGEATYLITNWHNLSGRNPLSGQPMAPSAAIPDQIAFVVFERVGPDDGQGFYEMRGKLISCPLYDEPNADGIQKARWLEHPVHGRDVDVAAIDVTSLVAGTLVRHANDVESDAVLDLAAAQDVFIVGFPFGIIAGAPAPLWKRGTIALDPKFDPGGLPKLLVDTATRQGMSGSVAIARHIIVGTPYKLKDGTDGPLAIFARKDVVIGVYSGRHYPDLEKAQLGIVWKRETIEDTVGRGRTPELP